MQTNNPLQTLGSLAGQVLPPPPDGSPDHAPRRPRTADLSVDQLLIGTAKRIFCDACRDLCPGFVFSGDLGHIYRSLIHWCLCDDDGPYDPAKGLFLWGNIGTGKSTLIQALKATCRILRDGSDPPRHPSWRIVAAGQMCRDYQADGSKGIEPYIRSLSLCIDDLGTENTSTNHYGTVVNVIADILLARYDLRRTHLTHVTTNMSPSQICSLYGERVYDRMGEMFNFINLAGPSHRPAIKSDNPL